jgi:hypothetical protein|tara:strand:- start:26 stop:202 length:177 start_codon:yes stop_codon:yes gene_type:complete
VSAKKTLTHSKFERLGRLGRGDGAIEGRDATMDGLCVLSSVVGASSSTRDDAVRETDP